MPYLYQTLFDTPLGEMIAISNVTSLLLLEFSDQANLNKEIEQLGKYHQAQVLSSESAVLMLVKEQLSDYFQGRRYSFSVPIELSGTPFQLAVWKSLTKIPYGKTLSYKAQSNLLNKPTAIRAVASANGKNRLSILVPCHRVIGHNGALTGYAGGIWRKQWLLEFEKKYKTACFN